jgi:hypothetical protein
MGVGGVAGDLPGLCALGRAAPAMPPAQCVCRILMFAVAILHLQVAAILDSLRVKQASP